MLIIEVVPEICFEAWFSRSRVVLLEWLQAHLLLCEQSLEIIILHHVQLRQVWCMLLGRASLYLLDRSVKALSFLLATGEGSNVGAE